MRSVAPSTARLQQPTVPHMHINSTHFMERESSLAYSQQPATCSYPHALHSNPRQLTLVLTYILILSPHLRERLPSELSPAPSTHNSHTCHSTPSQSNRNISTSSQVHLQFCCNPDHDPPSQLDSRRSQSQILPERFLTKRFLATE